MLDEYKMKGPTSKLEVEVEKSVIEILEKMTSKTKITLSEMANTALKTTIAADSTSRDTSHDKV